MAEHTIHETAAGIEHDTMRRTLETREKQLFAALAEQREREVELVEQRELAEEEIARKVKAAKDMISRRDEIAQALVASQAELDQLRADDQEFEATLQERVKDLGNKLQDSTLARRTAELELEQRERALHNLQTETDGARDTLAQEKQQLFTLRVDTKEQMLSEVLEETMKAQEAFMNKEQVDRALKSMRAELATTQAATESRRREMYQYVAIHGRVALKVLDAKLFSTMQKRLLKLPSSAPVRFLHLIRYRREMRDDLREATVAAEAMQGLTQIVAAENDAKAAELQTVRAQLARKTDSRQRQIDAYKRIQHDYSHKMSTLRATAERAALRPRNTSTGDLATAYYGGQRRVQSSAEDGSAGRTAQEATGPCRQPVDSGKSRAAAGTCEATANESGNG
jgi:chromosome segregation ATPase